MGKATRNFPATFSYSTLTRIASPRPCHKKYDPGRASSSLRVGEVIEYLKGLPTFTEYKGRLQKPFALNQITAYPLTYAILERYADIRRTLRPLHQEIGIDTLIAATALEYDLTLLTIDTDYDRVPHLNYELIQLKNAA